MRIRSILLATAAVLGIGFSPAQAQTYPSRPITLIIPQAPGGGSDTIGRYIAEKLKDRLGQPIVTENRAGAAGMLGAAAVKRAPADGYTLLLGAIDTVERGEEPPHVVRDEAANDFAHLVVLSKIVAADADWRTAWQAPAVASRTD